MADAQKLMMFGSAAEVAAYAEEVCTGVGYIISGEGQNGRGRVHGSVVFGYRLLVVGGPTSAQLDSSAPLNCFAALHSRAACQLHSGASAASLRTASAPTLPWRKAGLGGAAV